MPLPSGYAAINSYRDAARNLRKYSVLYRQTWTDPEAADDNGYSVSHAGAGAAGTTSMTLGGALASGGVGTADYARNVVITVTHATAVVAMSGVITGTDIHGKTITEAWSVTAGTASKVFTGAKAFKTVTSITEVVAADASANTIIAGTGVKFGLERYNEVASAVKEVAAGSVVTNGTVTARSTSASADARGTYAPNTAPDAANDYEIWYIVEDLIEL